MTDTDRQRLAAILGMLGSEHQGERDNAALQAEAFRRKHGLTWDELVSGAPPSWVQQAEDVMRAATKRIAELEDEIQSLAQRRPAAAPPPPEPPKPEPFVWAPWTPPDLTPSPPIPEWWDRPKAFFVFITFVTILFGLLIRYG